MNTLEVSSQSTESVVRRFYNPEPEKRQFYIGLCILLWSILAYLFISHYVMMAVEIKGASMSPTLLDGQHYILYRCPYLWRAPRTGEIVVIHDPEDHQLSIKRIIGLPNQLVEIRHDGVYVDNEKLAEPYLTAEAAWASGHKLIKSVRLGPNEFYVLGDNRDRSADSRIYGSVPKNSILGLIHKP
ncbi:MAG TPA: signal peptidase I [Verrucomicrobiae bacterium]|jgi:signal peptidase I|nr:signal peptidase I [Verrucomicrobiae bacterium]